VLYAHLRVTVRGVMTYITTVEWEWRERRETLKSVAV
jgi:hypothetical protein